MTAYRDRDDDDVVAVDEEEVPRRGSPLRLILLILLALVGLCVLCFLGSRFLPNNLLGALPIQIPGVSPGELASPTPIAGIETPTLVPTDSSGVPPIDTTEPSPGATEEPVVTTEPVPGTGEPTVTGQHAPGEHEEPGATEEPATVEPTDEIIDEHGGEIPTATTVPVPGPTATPTLGPTPTGQAGCDNNTPPVAEAGDPYAAMMGKGQAFVTFDGSGSSDSDGTIVKYEWDFGDGSEPAEGQNVVHGYSSTGAYVATLTVTDNCGATAQDTVDVTITGPTPPPPGTGTPTATTQPNPGPTPTSQPPDPGAGTLGFCYRVQPGNTLTGIAYYFGVPVPILAEVNGVSPAYYVVAGQGLFIPVSEIQSGPNVYEVQPGDTLDSIAFHCGLSTAKLASANGLTPGQSLTPGQLLGIPLWGWY